MNIRISRSQISLYKYFLDNSLSLVLLWVINFVLTHLKFMVQESSSTLQSNNFHSQWVNAHFNRAIEMNVISLDSQGRFFFIRGISIYLYKGNVISGSILNHSRNDKYILFTRNWSRDLYFTIIRMKDRSCNW